VTKKQRTLDIDEDLNFQRKEWFGQRVGIALLAAFVIAALLGFTGSGGVMNHATAGERGGAIFVEYDRIVRRGAMTSMTLHFHSDPPGFIQFWVSAPYLADVRIESVAPIPQTVTVEENRQVYTIRAASTDVAVTIELEHKSVGRLHGEVGVVGGPSAQFRQVSLF
jgi:hypothetical protein